MKILESYCVGKNGTLSECEDLIHVTQDFAMVADGVSSPRGSEKADQTGAAIIAQAIDSLPADIQAFSAIAHLTTALRYAEQTQGKTLAACAVIYSRIRRQIWLIGDCQYIAGSNHHHPLHAVDDLIGRLRAFVVEAELAAGKNIQELQACDTGRQMIEQFIRLQSHFANSAEDSEFAYGVINGHEIPARLIHVYNVPPGVPEIVLASDGYPILKKTLAATDAALADLLFQDPLCFRIHRATKGVTAGNVSFDDRAYLRLNIEN